MISPVNRVSTTFFATPWHNPSQIASRLCPSCWAWTRSVLAKTAQREAILGRGSELARASSASAWIPSRLSRRACWSRKLPVPAAQSELAL